MNQIQKLDQRLFDLEECPPDAIAVVATGGGIVYFSTHQYCEPLFLDHVCAGSWLGRYPGKWVEAKGYRCDVPNWPDGCKLYRSFHC